MQRSRSQLVSPYRKKEGGKKREKGVHSKFRPLSNERKLNLHIGSHWSISSRPCYQPRSVSFDEGTGSTQCSGCSTNSSSQRMMIDPDTSCGFLTLNLVFVGAALFVSYWGWGPGWEWLPRCGGIVGWYLIGLVSWKRSGLDGGF